MPHRRQLESYSIMIAYQPGMAPWLIDNTPDHIYDMIHTTTPFQIRIIFKSLEDLVNFKLTWL